MKETISKTSWCIMILSLLIDMISHARSFPSYNIVIGVFAWYAAQSFKMEDGKYIPNDNNQNTTPSSTSTLVNILSCFTTMTLFSIILDVVFCFIWGSEIIDGDVRSVKLSFSLFIMNMIPKAVATLWVLYRSNVICLLSFDLITILIWFLLLIISEFCNVITLSLYM